ncbi:MAG TPA: O-antigen ligase family protein [bacterium]|nr:MAG: O-Antigen ligase [Parcubacteria group bacterium ADurb.Bin115]HNU81746.1 O-antigen ligase family protein [bacterium]HOD87311.1 O-antigen ligase family protein [bacterium]
MEILTITSLILFTVIAAIRLDWALFLILAALPAYLLRFNLGPIPMTTLEAMIIIVFTSWFFRARPWQRFKKKDWQERRQKYPYSLEIIGILITAWSGLAIAGFDNASLGIFKAYFLEPIMLYLVVINRGQGSYRKFIWPLALSAALVSLVTFFQQLTGLFIFNDFWALASQRRVTSVFPYPNAVGLYLGPIIFLMAGAFASYPRRSNLLTASKKILLLLIIISAIAAIFFAKSEGALIGLAGGAMIVSLLYNKRSRQIAAGIITAGILVLIISNPAWQYFQKKATLMDLSGQIRRQQWKETMQMLKNGRLISGAGLSNYQEAVKPFHQEGIFVKNDDPDWYRKVVWNDEYKKQVWQPVEIYLYPHNIFLNFWTEIGLFGALLFTWLIGRYFYESIRLKDKLERSAKMINLGLIGAMSTIVIHGLVDVPYFKNDLAIIFWLLIAMFGLLKIKQKQTE